MVLETLDVVSCAPFAHDKILFPLRLSSFAEKLYFILLTLLRWLTLSLTDSYTCQYFFLGYRPRRDRMNASTHASPEVPCSKLNEGGNVQKNLFSKKCYLIHDGRDHIGGSNSNRSWNSVVVPVRINWFPESNFGDCLWREQLTAYEPPVKDSF